MRICLLANARSAHTRKWAGHFAGAGHQVYVLTFTPDDVPGAEIVPLPRCDLSSVRYLLFAPIVRRLVAKIGPDLLHAHYASGYGTLGSLCGFHPYIVSLWGSDVFEFPRRSWLHSSLLRRTLASADALCSTSVAMAREAALYTERTIRITPFGVDCKSFRAMNDRGVRRSQVIGTIRTLERSYGIEDLIRAFAMVITHFDRVRPKRYLELRIGGDGPLRS